MHDFVLMMANTGLPSDEISKRNLLHRDVSIIRDEATDEDLAHRSPRQTRCGLLQKHAGKPSVRMSDCSTARCLGKFRKASGQGGAAAGNGPAEELPPRYPQPNDPVFPTNHVDLFNGVLKRANLKFDREGNRRTAYSLRHTYMYAADGRSRIYQIAKNCRTSVEMIEKFYASHITNSIDAAAINVRKRKSEQRPSKGHPKDRKLPFRHHVA